MFSAQACSVQNYGSGHASTSATACAAAEGSAKARVALPALTVAEYFRDTEGQDVLLFVDNTKSMLLTVLAYQALITDLYATFADDCAHGQHALQPAAANELAVELVEQLCALARRQRCWLGRGRDGFLICER